MAIMLSSLTLSRRIPNWVSLSAHLSSLSCVMKMKLQPAQKSDRTQSNFSEFETKVQLLKNKLYPDSLVSVLGTTPDLNSSTKLFKWTSLQKRFTHSAETYHMMIFKLGMAGNVDEMEVLCNEVVRDKPQGFDKSLLALIDSFVSNHRLSEALRVLYVMNSTSVHPSIDIFNSLMGALVEGKRDFKDVLFVYKEMVKSGTAPNIDTLNYLLEALFESGRVDFAIDQYRRLEKKGCASNVRTFCILISGLAARNRVEESISIMEDMFRCEYEPDFGFYNCIIPIFCSLHNLEIGSRLFAMMKASNIAPNSVIYISMIKCFCEFDHLDDALKLFNEMVDKCLSPDHRVCLDIVNALCKSGRIAEAEFFLEEQNITDACPYNAILESYCDSGKFTMAQNVFDKMSERNITDVRSWNILIRFLCENSMIEKASEYVCRMVISSFPPDSATYSTLVLGNCETGNIVRALDLFSRIRSKCWVLDNVSYAKLVERLCQGGNIQEAYEVFCYMSGKGCSLQPMTFSVLIEKICLSGEINRAIKLLSLAYYTGTTSISANYNNILTVLFKSGPENYFFVILSRMIVVGCDFDVETYCILIKCISSLGRRGDCVYLFNLMIGEDLMPDSQTLVCLFSCLAKYSELHLILSSIEKLVAAKSEILDSNIFNLLIDGLWIEGYKDEASRFLDLMLDKGWVPDASTHALLIGSSSINQMVANKSVENNDGEDYVSCILEESLGKK